MKKLSLVLSLVLFSLSMIVAQRTVTGTVTSDDGSPLVGATIQAKGTNAGTATDVDGTYSLEVPDGANTLIFSFTGFGTQELELNASNILDVQMNQGVTLSETVVTALGISRSSKSLGYSTSVVSGDDLNVTRNTSALDALNGKVAGLTVSTASGAPGASTVVNIRGFNSVTGNNQPLFVIDGVPMNNRGNSSSSSVQSNSDFNRSQDFGNQMNDINPNDIESVNVLKGSAASALYGSRAANGVILITTKKGKEGKLVVDINSSFFNQEVLRIPFLQNTYGQGWSGLFQYEENGSWGPRTDDQVRRWGNVVDNSQQLKKFSIQKDNIRDFFEIGTGSNTGISIGGGNKTSNYRLSYSYAKADGVVPSNADSYKRNTVSLAGGLKGNKLTLNTTLNYVNKNQKAVATGQGDDAGGGKVVWQELIQIPRDHSIVDSRKYNSTTDPAAKFYDLDNYFTPYAQNPYWTLDNQGNNYDENRIYGNLDVTYDILPKLKLTWRGGADVSGALQKDWGNIGTITPGTPNSSANNVVGSVAEITRNNSQINSDIILTYDTDISSDFNFSASLGQNINARSSKTLLSSVTNLGIPDYFNLSNTTATPITQTSESKQRLLGVYAAATFGYKNWAYLSLAARNDWSSTLPKNGNSYFYPGGSLSLVLSEAFSMPKSIDFLKVRVGYARTGNDASPYQINPVYIPGVTRAGGFANINFPFGGISSFELSNNPGNPNLRPELTDELEYGVELKLFKRRIGIEATYYNKDTKDQIVSLLVDGASGYTNQTINLGVVNNKGIELMLNTIPLQTRNFEWGLDINFTKNNNVVKSLGFSDKTSILLNSSYLVELRAEVGKPLGAVYSPQALTNDKGQVVVNPVTGLPLNNTTEKAYRGSINPDFTVGFGTHVKFKSFTLGGNGDFRKGGVFYSYTARLNYFVGNAWNSQYNDRQPWIVPNSVVSNPDGTFSENTTPVSRANVFTYYGANDAYQYNHVLDKTFFKIRNIYLNYDLKTSIAKSVSCSKIVLGVFARNPVLWTPSENHFVDPEANTFGTSLRSLYGEFSTGPSASSYGAQLNITF